MTHRCIRLTGLVALTGLTLSTSLLAQEPEAPAPEAPASDATNSDASATEPAPPVAEPPADASASGEDPAAPEGEAGAADPTGPAGKEVDAELIADAEAGNSPAELPGKTYHFVGARFRGIVVPKFMVNLFGDGGRTVLAPAFGAEYINRKDGFEYNLALSFASYAMKATPFKAKSDGAIAWEIVRSEIKVLYVTGDFMWSNEFTPEFALTYGMGAGLGFVFGNLYRQQATPPAGQGLTADPYSWVPCPAKGVSEVCGNDNDHYGNYTEPSWADGGSKPIVFPWLTIQSGLRYKPHRNFAMRLDVGFGTSGFMFGIGADYGL